MCAIKDLYSNRIVGYSIDSRMKASLTVAALRNAVALRAPAPGLIVHSDRGSQFRSNKFVRALKTSPGDRPMNHTTDPAGPPREPELPLTPARRRDTARRRLQVHNAIAAHSVAGTPVTVSSIARAARVHRIFIHRHPDLHAAVLAAAAVPANPASSNSAVSIASLRADLLNARAHNSRLQQHIHALENRLSQTLGEAVFRDSGLGAPDDIHSLRQALTDREQQLLELRRQLEERDGELAAARAANRELMTQFNTRV